MDDVLGGPMTTPHEPMSLLDLPALGGDGPAGMMVVDRPWPIEAPHPLPASPVLWDEDEEAEDEDDDDFLGDDDDLEFEEDEDALEEESAEGDDEEEFGFEDDDDEAEEDVEP